MIKNLTSRLFNERNWIFKVMTELGIKINASEENMQCKGDVGVKSDCLKKGPRPVGGLPSVGSF